MDNFKVEPGFVSMSDVKMSGQGSENHGEQPPFAEQPAVTTFAQIQPQPRHDAAPNMQSSLIQGVLFLLYVSR